MILKFNCIVKNASKIKPETKLIVTKLLSSSQKAFTITSTSSLSTTKLKTLKRKKGLTS